MLIKKLLAIMAPIAPAAVAFHIHQVVPAFQMSILSSVNRKNLILFFSWSAIDSNGTHAKKMRKVKGETGHAATSSKPVRILNISEEYFFK